MFWAKNRPLPEATTDFAARPPAIVSTSTRTRSAAVNPSAATRVVVVVVGIVVVAADVDVVDEDDDVDAAIGSADVVAGGSEAAGVQAAANIITTAESRPINRNGMAP